MVYTGDLARAMLLAEVARTAPGRAYWIADAEPYELREVLQTVRDALEAEGIAVSRRRPPPIPRAMSVFAANLDRVLQANGRYGQALHVLGELKDTIACDISRARAELGFEPGGGLLQGMDMLLSQECEVPVHLTERPLETVVLGAGSMLEHLADYRSSFQLVRRR